MLTWEDSSQQLTYHRFYVCLLSGKVAVNTHRKCYGILQSALREAIFFFLPLGIEEMSDAFYFQLDLNLRYEKREKICYNFYHFKNINKTSALFFSLSLFCDCEEQLVVHYWKCKHFILR